ncbi:alpha/beta hydrolase family protein [Bdellovibrio svalbardensis]|uniref:Polyhydroxybutyrate depolymerase n=1 Tax=Bdellovibrio svalbardensis TaxID=2972972 RepID=A0ABT6DKF2_9BACT|nr:hypothetical protein [Bdellovibrio svalbardensis]MDG0817131.1 hypothetical protein [Bdellovibrio svalbardensis]
MKRLALFLFALMTLPATGQTRSLTISGISSGGFMASQMATIYSDQFSGVATVAGGVFFCAQNVFQNNLSAYGQAAYFNYGVNAAGHNTPSILEPLESNPLYQALGVCMQHPEKAHQNEAAKTASAQPMNLDFLNDFVTKQLIADTSNISEQRVLIYQGTNDETVRAGMADRLQEFYTRLGATGNQLKMVFSEGNHNFPTLREDGIPCAEAKPPYIANCKIDLAGQILTHLLNRNLVRSKFNEHNFHVVSQTKGPDSVASYGYLYANPLCLNKPSACDLHVALHGCKMSDSFDKNFQAAYEAKVQLTRVLNIQDYELKARSPKMGALAFAKKAGYAEYAEASANHLMVFFPQTQITSDNYPANPNGCWDWYGWTGKEYATNQGSEPSWLIQQINAIKKNPRALLLQEIPQ